MVVVNLYPFEATVQREGVTFEEVIEQTAVPLTSSQGCGGIGSTEIPNNVYGWGRIDALAACNYSLDFRVTVDPETVAVCAPSPAVFDISVEQFQGFNEPVTLSASGLPAGASAGKIEARVVGGWGSTWKVMTSGAAIGLPERSTISGPTVRV